MFGNSFGTPVQQPQQPTRPVFQQGSGQGWPMTQQQFQQQYQQPQIPQQQMLTVKLFLPKDEIRRVTIDIAKGTFPEIKHQLVKNLKQNHQEYARHVEHFDDGDWVRFSSDQEWQDVKRRINQPTGLASVPVLHKFRIIVKKPKTVEPVIIREVVESVPVVEFPPVPISPRGEAPQVPQQEESEDEMRKSMAMMSQSFRSLLQQAPQKVEPQPLQVSQPPQLPEPSFQDTKNKYDDLLIQLNEMGFKDREKNIQLLEQYKGNVLEVVQHYLN